MTRKFEVVALAFVKTRAVVPVRMGGKLYW